MKRSLLPLFAALAAAAAVATAIGCASEVADDNSAPLPDAGTDAAPEDAAPALGFQTDAAPPPPPPYAECAEEVQQIFVVATDKALYRFYPDKLQFVRIGQLDCPSSAGTFSMAVDRRGIAYVEFTDGRLFAVDTSTAACKPTAFQPAQPGFATFGMGYAKNDDDAGETLFASGSGLGKIDTSTFQLGFVGSLALGRTELTGRGNELFAFSVANGVVAKLDKQTAATKESYRTSAIEEQAGFAFAHWGGDFWLFTGTSTSSVTRFSPKTGDSTVVVPDAGMEIVGAGSSTCAPIAPPR